MAWATCHSCGIRADTPMVTPTRLAPLHLYGLVLFLLPLLAACGSDTPASSALVNTSPETDREALVALYNATDGPTWMHNENWLSDAPMFLWRGVDTNVAGLVTQLVLNDNQLSGEIPPALGNLANLRVLDLSSNELTWDTPPALGNLANLQGLWLQNNQLSGWIPAGVGQPRPLNPAAPQRQPAERVRTRQLAGPIGYGVLRPGRPAVLLTACPAGVKPG